MTAVRAFADRRTRQGGAQRGSPTRLDPLAGATDEKIPQRHRRDTRIGVQRMPTGR